ncbi:MAG: PAS domain S-box protein, partial [Thermodesulfobacteriota bacterium]
MELPRTDQRSSQMTAPWRLYLLVGLIGLLVAGAVGFSWYTGHRAVAVYSPLVEAALEIKVEAALGHLWFEEVMTGDVHDGIEKVWRHLDQAEWYARAMLEGGQSPGGVSRPLEDQALRRDILAVLAGLGRFRETAGERYRIGLAAGPGSDIEQRFDVTFNEFLQRADEVEHSLQGAIDRDLAKFQIFQAVLLLASVVLTLAVVVLIHRHDRRRVKDFLEVQAARLEAEEKERWLSTTLNSLGDGVIATDPVGLVTFLNPVAKDLTDWPSEEASGRAIEEVFRIVNEETGRPVENPVARVLREGKVVGLANHTELISRQGLRRPIADSGAPILNEAGDLLGTVMVFHDISDRREAERALARSEERFRRLFDEMSGGCVLLEAPPGGGENPADFRLLEVNRAFEILTGLPGLEIKGRTVREALSGFEDSAWKSVGLTAADGRPRRFELSSRFLSRHFEVTVYRPEPGKAAVILNDI